MGQARQRGTLEVRVEQAREQANTDMEVRRKEVEELEAFEQRQVQAIGNFVSQRIMPMMEKQYGPLMRADFSNIPLQFRKPQEDA